MSDQTGPPAEIQRHFSQGYAPDHLEIDRLLIEIRNCPECAKKLHYAGVSNSARYIAFGWCACGYVKRFWTEECAIQIRTGKYAKEAAK